jgi:hypothetical protein
MPREQGQMLSAQQASNASSSNIQLAQHSASFTIPQVHAAEM